MAYAIYDNAISLPANGDLSGSQYKLGTINSSGKVAVTGAGAAADGVIQNDPAAADRAVSLLTDRGTVSKAVAGAAVSNGDQLESDSTGRVITRSSGIRVGKALAAAAAAGDIIPVLLYLESA